MENKSKLPVSSKKKPSSLNVVVLGKVRRSKSVDEFANARKNAFQNGAKTLSSSSTSVTGVKRPAATKAEASKAKVPKKAKIPDWDYKSRFLDLKEKHTKLLEDYNKEKEINANSKTIQEQLNALQIEVEILRKDKTKLEGSVKSMNTEIARLKKIEIEYLKIKDPYEDLVNKSKGYVEELENLKRQNLVLNSDVDTLNGKLKKMENDLFEEEVLRRDLHNIIQDLKGNIRVFCRVRPPTSEKENSQSKCVIDYPDENTLEIIKNPSLINTKQSFTFHQVFDENSTQEDFFEELSQFVQSAIDGYHVCVFAYGQTGSGKTYTMQGLGTPEHLGMIPRTVNLIFNSIESLTRSNWEYEVKVSFLEIYNENVRDLLDDDAKKKLDVRYNEGKGTTVTNLKILPIKSYRDFQDYMSKAEKNRRVAATNFNEHSSRSHAITKIYIEGKHLLNNKYYVGSVNLVDLAGSESAKTSEGDRLVETKAINKSLSTLGNVMLALYNKEKHIPYRNSKLTYLLQSSLGGNSKTMMIVNIAPFEDNFSESINSLRFASIIKEVKTKFKRNKALMPITNK